MTRAPFYSLLMLVWMVVTLYICVSTSQPVDNNQDDSNLEEAEPWSVKEKRPFCNAFAGCGRKRAMAYKEARASAHEKALNNHQRLNPDSKLLEKLIGRLQLYKSNSVQDSMEYSK